MQKRLGQAKGKIGGGNVTSHSSGALVSANYDHQNRAQVIKRQSLSGLSESVFLYTPDGERYYSYNDDRQPGQARTHAIFELMGLYESGSNEQTEHRFFIAPGVIYTRFGAAVSGGEITNIAKEQYTYSFKDRLGSPVVAKIGKDRQRSGQPRFSTPKDHHSLSVDRQPGLARTHAIFELMGLYESGGNAQGSISNEQTEHRYFIAPGVIYTRFGAAVSGGEITNIAKEQYTYSFKDRLGSPVVQMITKTGEAPRIERRGFDPFGKPRDGNLLDSNQGRLGPIVPAAGLDPSKLPTSMRGFTDHQHLDGLQLIHMRGRIYDYNLGRFWSVDPIIQFPANSQSLNAYSYIMNNPMSGTDPTGYAAIGQTKVLEQRGFPMTGSRIHGANTGASGGVTVKTGTSISQAPGRNPPGSSVSILVTITLNKSSLGDSGSRGKASATPQTEGERLYEGAKKAAAKGFGPIVPDTFSYVGDIVAAWQNLLTGDAAQNAFTGKTMEGSAASDKRADSIADAALVVLSGGSSKAVPAAGNLLKTYGLRPIARTLSAAGDDLLLKKAVNSNLPHAIERGVMRGVFQTAEEAGSSLRSLTGQISTSGFPTGTLVDTANAGRFLVPVGDGGLAVYQLGANGTAKLKTVLIAR